MKKTSSRIDSTRQQSDNCKLADAKIQTYTSKKGNVSVFRDGKLHSMEINIKLNPKKKKSNG